MAIVNCPDCGAPVAVVARTTRAQLKDRAQKGGQAAARALSADARRVRAQHAAKARWRREE